MTRNQFLEKQNINMLWDLIADEDIFKNHSTQIKETILRLFSENIRDFYNTESKSNISLMEMNKKYILMILNFIKKNLPVPIHKIKIYDSDDFVTKPQMLNIESLIQPDNMVTIEERKKGRITEFDAKLHMVEEEFKNAMSLPIPEIPKFSDNLNDEPIIELEKAIKQMAEQRNYDLQQLTSQNNMVKQEQQQPIINSNGIQNNDKRHIHWADQQKEENMKLTLEEEENDIFSKLKPVSKININNTEIERKRLTKLEETIDKMKIEMNEMKSNISEILFLLKK